MSLVSVLLRTHGAAVASGTLETRAEPARERSTLRLRRTFENLCLEKILDRLGVPDIVEKGWYKRRPEPSFALCSSPALELSHRQQ